MKLHYKIIPILPVFVLIFQLTYLLNQHDNTLSPISNKNSLIQNFTSLLHSARINYNQIKINSIQNEIEIIVINNNRSFKTILSTQKNLLNQVTALQKVIKIANIKKQEIKFIDLSSDSPYATF